MKRILLVCFHKHFTTNSDFLCYDIQFNHQGKVLKLIQIQEDYKALHHKF